MDFPNGGVKILFQLIEAAIQRSTATNQNIIVTWLPERFEMVLRDGAKPSLCPISCDCVAQLLGRRKTDPNSKRIMIIPPRQALQDKTRGCPATAVPRQRSKFRAFR